MSCQPEQVTALVDGVLAGRLAAEVEAHCEGCERCRAQAVAEHQIRERLRALPQPEPQPGFEARLRGRFRRRRDGMRRLVWTALPAAAVLIAGLWLRGFAPFVTWSLSRDHDHCRSFTVLPAAVRSEDHAVLASHFAGRGTRMPGELPDALAGRSLFGGRYCLLANGSWVPHVYYVGAGGVLSLFVLTHDVRTGALRMSRSRGNTVALVALGSDLVGVVGERPEDVRAAVRQLRSAAVVASDP